MSSPRQNDRSENDDDNIDDPDTDKVQDDSLAESQSNTRDDQENNSSFDVEMESSQNAEEEVQVNERNQEEIYRLAGRKPLITILNLMVGPVISQVTGALYGIINSIWVSKKLGEQGLSAVATEITFEGIGRAFGFFLMIAGSTKISQLFGRKQFDDATQVACDLMRLTIVCGIIVPVVILPSHDPMCKWFKASKQTMEWGFQYILPLCACSVLTCLNLCCQGFLQAEGRTMLIGFIDLVALVVACGGICPLLLFGLNVGICSASVSTICADAVPGIVLCILYFRGKFGIKLNWRQLFKPFSKHTWPALVVGLSQLVSNLSACIPGIPIRNLIGRSCGDDHIYDLAMASFNVCCRVFQFGSCICIAVTTGFIPPASYAHAANNDKRYLKLAMHAAWINLVWSIFITILALAIPRQISMIFGSGEEYLDYSVPILMNSNYLGWFRWVQLNSQAMLQALQYGVHAMIVSMLSNFVGFLIFAYILFYTDKHNVKRLMYLYTCTTGFGTVVGLALLSFPLWKLYKKSKEQNVNKEDLKEIRNDSKNDDFDSRYLDSDGNPDEKNVDDIEDGQSFESNHNTDTTEVNKLDEI